MGGVGGRRVGGGRREGEEEGRGEGEEEKGREGGGGKGRGGGRACGKMSMTALDVCQPSRQRLGPLPSFG